MALPEITQIKHIHVARAMMARRADSTHSPNFHAVGFNGESLLNRALGAASRCPA